MPEDSSNRKRIGIFGRGDALEAVAHLAGHNAVQFATAEGDDSISTDHSFAVVEPSAFRNIHLIFCLCGLSRLEELTDWLGEYLSGRHILVYSAVGFRQVGQRYRRASEIIEQNTPVRRYGLLTGPFRSEDILDGRRASAVCATEYPEVTELVEDYLQSGKFLLYRTRDTVGAELSASYVRLLAFGLGVLDEMEAGASMKATLFSRGLREMASLVESMGAEARTAFGLAGLGNLKALDDSQTGSDIELGREYARGTAIDETEQPARSLFELLEGFEARIDSPRSYPIFENIRAFIRGEKQLEAAIENLFEIGIYRIDGGAG